jgi:hypothetical protein
MESRKTLKTFQCSALRQAMEWLCDDRMFADCTRHGNTSWSLRALACMALFWAWGAEATLERRFASGLDILARLFPRREWGRTYQGFIKILNRWTPTLRSALVNGLRDRMRQLDQQHATLDGWTVMAVDGTRIEAPRTTANLAWFRRVPPKRTRRRTSKRRSKSQRVAAQQPAAPQVWLTVIWHVGLGLLWDWRQGPSGSSERVDLKEMLPALPTGSLIVADAGFQGYEYWAAALNAGHSFLIRAAGNVRLLRDLGCVRRRRNIVYLWPDQVRRRQQPPIVLRLFELHDGRRHIFLVTNVTDPKQLSKSTASRLYRRRWGVEVFFRGFKQTFGRGKLRSRAPQNVELELDWSLLGLWCVELLAVRELIDRGLSPADLSTAGALRAMQQTLMCAVVGIDFALSPRLAAIRHDGYQRRQKAIRIWPRKKRAPPSQPPQITSASVSTTKPSHAFQTTNS